MKFVWLRLFFWCSLFLFGAPVEAQPITKGLSLNQTRVIFNEHDGSAAVSIRNQSDKPWLVRSRVTVTQQGEVLSPFMVTPPLFRLDAYSQHAVRIIRQGESRVPKDRESVFYVSMLAIPSTSLQGGDSHSDVSARVMVGIDTVIKLFYRPTQLRERAADAPRQLQFIQYDGKLKVVNPTEYHITLASLKVDDVNVPVQHLHTSMIPPFSDLSFPQKHKAESVAWSVITDFGGISQEHRGLVQQEAIK